MQDQRRKYTETPGGEKASARPRSALARGGSTAVPGKRSVFPQRLNAQTIISDYFAVYRFCVKTTIYWWGRGNRTPNSFRCSSNCGPNLLKRVKRKRLRACTRALSLIL